MAGAMNPNGPLGPGPGSGPGAMGGVASVGGGGANGEGVTSLPLGGGGAGGGGMAPGKTPSSTMEAQYMQQQSQIFVFSTNLANKSAEAVLQGQFQTIIAFHCSQPGTKKFLEVLLRILLLLLQNSLKFGFNSLRSCLEFC